MGSVVNVVGTGIAAIVSEGLPTEVRAVATSGPTEWLPMMNSGEMDFGILNVWDARAAWKGESVYGELSDGSGFSILLIASGHKALAGIVVAEDSGIRNAGDLRGKRFVGGYTGSPGITAEALALLANQGLQPEDVKMVTMPSVSAGVRAVIEGLADANGASNVGMGVIAELDAVKGARFLPCDPSPEGVKRLQDIFPATIVKVSPGPDKTGVKEEMYLMSYDFYFVARADLSDDSVYRVVQTLWEKNDALTRINMHLRDWTPVNFVNSQSAIPYHPGAIRFYREQAVWSEEEQLNQQTLQALKPTDVN